MDEDSPAKAQLDRGLRITVNLEAAEPGEIIAYKAKRYAPAIELDEIGYYATEEFWEVRHQNGQQESDSRARRFLYSGLARASARSSGLCRRDGPFDPSDGEFRIHYAGFFDPGFGYGSSDIKGTRAVLEVRAHEVPFLMEHGQLVGRLNYMPLLSRPEKIYGTNIGSSYQHQALTLSKQFRREATR